MGALFNSTNKISIRPLVFELEGGGQSYPSEEGWAVIPRSTLTIGGFLMVIFLFNKMMAYIIF